jgi:hypothetical protein
MGFGREFRTIYFVPASLIFLPIDQLFVETPAPTTD